MHPEGESRPALLGFARAIELFLEDMRGLGRLTTDRSVAEYRRTVRTHAEDAQDAGPCETTRQHVKATLRRWGHLTLADVLGMLLEDLPEDAFPGEEPAEVLVEMLTGTLRPAAEAAGERVGREAA